MSRCPTCGQSIGATDTVTVLARMQLGSELYRGQNGLWYLTHGGGKISEGVVRELLSAGSIRDKYSDTPNTCYTTGRTIDTAATLAFRKGRKRKEWKLIYVGDSQ